MDGQPIEMGHVGGTIALLLLAGIDTTWSAIGASLWHLAGHADDRDRLVAEPELLPIAMEELLRAYAPVTMARLVKHDMDWNGCPMKADDWVLLPFPAGNRDPRRSRMPTRSSSTARRTGTPRSASASIDAPDPTSPAWSCASRSRCGSKRSRRSRWPTPTQCRGQAAKCVAPESCHCASADPSDGRRARRVRQHGPHDQRGLALQPVRRADRTDHRDRRRDPADAGRSRDPAAAPCARLRDRRPLVVARRPPPERVDARTASGRARRHATRSGARARSASPDSFSRQRIVARGPAVRRRCIEDHGVCRRRRRRHGRLPAPARGRARHSR